MERQDRYALVCSQGHGGDTHIRGGLCRRTHGRGRNEEHIEPASNQLLARHSKYGRRHLYNSTKKRVDKTEKTKRAKPSSYLNSTFRCSTHSALSMYAWKLVFSPVLDAKPVERNRTPRLSIQIRTWSRFVREITKRPRALLYLSIRDDDVNCDERHGLTLDDWPVIRKSFAVRGTLRNDDARAIEFARHYVNCKCACS